MIASTLRTYRRTFDFGGRETRRDFFSFLLFIVMASLVVNAVDAATFAVADVLDTREELDPSQVERWRNRAVGWFLLLNAVPLLSAAVRRLHDANHNAWMLLVVLIPYIGGLFLLGVLVQKGEPAPNIYGDNPRDEPPPHMADPDLFE